MYPHLQDTFSAFARLWNARNTDHITFAEIEAYARLYGVHDSQRFASLMIASDEAIHAVMKEVQDKKDKHRKRKRNGSST